jgi:hypothetical protein
MKDFNILSLQMEAEEVQLYIKIKTFVIDM